ncbi:MAG: cyclic nucleotide-binding domain-containing protein [Deltaproteobacteria bacterium]|nr:MAG: cyclic nucleotide-binding domain-containing protein [Deltaproteobacteria bacterium]
MDGIWGYIFPKKLTEREKMLKVLAQTPIFEGFSRSKLVRLQRILHERRFRAGETIFEMGEPGVGMYVIVEGEVSVTIVSELGEEEEVARLSQGQTFGDLALIENHLRSASVRAVTSTQLFGLIRSEFLDFLSNDPALGVEFLMRLLKMVGDRLHHTNRELVEARSKLHTLQNEIKANVDLLQLVSGGATPLEPIKPK